MAEDQVWSQLLFRIVSGVRAALADDPRSWHQSIPLSGWPKPQRRESLLEAKEEGLSSLENVAFLPTQEKPGQGQEGRVFVAELSLLLYDSSEQTFPCPPCQILSVSLQNCSRIYQGDQSDCSRTRSGWLRPNERGGQSYARVILPSLVQHCSSTFLRLCRSPALLFQIGPALGIGRCPSWHKITCQILG